MWKRSAAASPATARLERWKIARRYAARATPHTIHARLTARRYACRAGHAESARGCAQVVPGCCRDRPPRTGRRGPALGSPGDLRLPEPSAAEPESDPVL